MRYFAYGSNMFTQRLRLRCPSSCRKATGKLPRHALRWHKRSLDGSGKCDAYFTGDPGDVVWGVVFEIRSDEKPCLDSAEGLGRSYVQKDVDVLTSDGQVAAFTYVATPASINSGARPYTWYRDLVLAGAREHGLPGEYVSLIEAQAASPDPDRLRESRERSVEGGSCQGKSTYEQ